MAKTIITGIMVALFTLAMTPCINATVSRNTFRIVCNKTVDDGFLFREMETSTISAINDSPNIELTFVEDVGRAISTEFYKYCEPQYHDYQKTLHECSVLERTINESRSKSNWIRQYDECTLKLGDIIHQCSTSLFRFV